MNPPQIRETLTELLIANGIKEYAVSETQKYGHVTYFWNGNRSEKFSEELEDYCEIPSDVRSFDECPWMKGTEIAYKVIEAIRQANTVLSAAISRTEIWWDIPETCRQRR